jgi:hypothetical protein
LSRFEILKSDAHRQAMQEKSSELYCSFCGKSQHTVAALIQGPSVLICDECVDVCIEVLSTNKEWCRREIANLQRLLSR